MKRLLFLIALMLGFGTIPFIHSQNSTVLRFTGQGEQGTYVQLSSVEIKNITRGWEEILVYPDTILFLGDVGIDDYTSITRFSLSQNMPNPFKGSTDFSLQMPSQDRVYISVFDINGRKITEITKDLPQGIHIFRVILNTPQVYLVTAQTDQHSATIKIVNQGSEATNLIEYRGMGSGNISYEMGGAKNAHTDFEFEPGDIMRYIGKYLFDDVEYSSDTILQPQYESEDFYLLFHCIPLINSVFSVSVCDSLSWNGVTYTQSGTYTQTFQTANGCDSIVTLNLTIEQPVTSTISATVCGNYVWNGQTYTHSGTYTQTFQTANGCDSIVTLNLTVEQSMTSTISATVCGSYVWNGQTYTQSGTYTQTFTVANGCDSVVTLNLTVLQPITNSISATACSGYVWNGQTYVQSGTYTQTFTAANGCDSVVTLNLTIHQPIVNNISVTACGGYVWNGQTYVQSGTYTQTFTAANGCDSVMTLNLTVNQPVTNSISVMACGGYVWNGQTYVQSGTYTQTLTAANGCDSVVTLNLTVNQPVTNSFSVTACGGFVWNGQTYVQSGTYTQTFTAANGCDSVVTLNLTVNQPVTNSFSVTACGGYVWNGQTYVQSGTYTQTFSAANGCDSVVTLNLTVNQPITNSISATACGGYVWNGQTYVQSGTYTQTFSAANGCDSVVTLNLTVEQSVTSTNSATVCGTYSWNGQTYTQSGTYTQTFTAVNGCDSVVTLNLTVNQPVTSSISATACGGYVWNGQTYTQSGTYTQTFTATNSCDSVVTLNLTVHQPTLPVLSGLQVYEVSTHTVYVTAAVQVDSCSTVLSRGLCWNTSSNPTLADNHSNNGSGTGEFTDTITGLSYNTTYHVRAYATSEAGTAYGENVIFTTQIPMPVVDEKSCSGTPTVTDIDGNVYSTVKIGNQCWMRENLRTTHYADGTAISIGNSTSYTDPYYYDYSTHSLPLEMRGYLYNWPAAMHGAASSSGHPSGVQGICPTGWHLPSRSEWNAMDYYVGSQSEYTCDGNAGNIAKALASTEGWSSCSGECYPGDQSVMANNATGFSAMPAGGRLNSFSSAGNATDFWTSTEYSSSCAYRRHLAYDDAVVSKTAIDKNYARSVRCLRDSLLAASTPTVTTSAITSVGAIYATCGGNVISDGNAAVTERGLCWRTSPNPTLADSHTNDGSGMGEFTSTLTGLTSNTTYYVRAYATNIEGTAYGNEQTFTTNSYLSFSLLIDTPCTSNSTPASHSAEMFEYCVGTDSVRLSIGNYEYGIVQWQVSRDTVEWTDIKDANDTFYVFYPEESGYYRARMTYALCPSEYSQTIYLHLIPRADAGRNRVLNADYTAQLFGNEFEDATGLWTVLSGDSAVIDDPTDPYALFHGPDSLYVLTWTLTNSCGSSTDTVTLRFIHTVLADYIVVVDTTDLILSDSTELANGIYRIVFNYPVPTIVDSTILVGIPNGGFLRKVMAFEQTGDTVEMYTTQATLDDLIEEGAFNFDGSVLQSSGNSPSKGPKTVNGYVRLDHQPTRAELMENPNFQNGSKWCYEYPMELGFSDGSKSVVRNFSWPIVKNDILSIMPKFSISEISVNPTFTPIFDFYKSNGMYYVSFSNKAQILFSFKATLDASISGTYTLGSDTLDKQAEWSKTLTEIVQRYICPVGAVPVEIAIKFEVKFDLDASATITAQKTWKVSGALEYDQDLHCDNGNVSSSSSKSLKNFNVQDLSVVSVDGAFPNVNVNIGIDLATSLKAKVSLDVYEVLGPYAEIGAKLSLKSCASLNPYSPSFGSISSELSFDIPWKLGLAMKVLKKKIFDINLKGKIPILKLKDPSRLERNVVPLQLYNCGNGVYHPGSFKVIGGPVSFFTKNKVHIQSSSGYIASSMSGNPGNHLWNKTVIDTLINSGSDFNIYWKPNGSTSSNIKVEIKNCEGEDIDYSPMIVNATTGTSSCLNTTLQLSVVGGELRASGGQTPYIYSSDGVSFTQTKPTPLSGHTYYVRDANNCVAQCHTPEVFCNLQLSYQMNGTTVVAQAENGTPPYRFYLDGSSTPFVSGNSPTVTTPSLSYGDHTIRVMDQNGCSSAAQFTINDGKYPPLVAVNTAYNSNKNIYDKVLSYVFDDGDLEVTERGIYYSTNQNMSPSTKVVGPLGNGTGPYLCSIPANIAQNPYYVRAYAVNSKGTGYSDTVMISQTPVTPSNDGQPCPGTPTVTDYDGNIYNTVQIGQQCWMKENLRTTHFADGTGIGVSNSANSCYSSAPYYLSDNNVLANGYSYNWFAVMNGASSSDLNPSGIQGVCPAGWHVPSVIEWVQLFNYAGSQGHQPWSVCVSPMCATGSTILHFVLGYENYMGYEGCYWTTSFYDEYRPFIMALSYDSELESVKMHRLANQYPCRFMKSRCLRDDTTKHVPSVGTGEFSGITPIFAACTGQVTCDGGDTVTERGLCWSTEPYPTIENPHLSEGSGLGEYTGRIVNLQPNTTYYVRAYASNGIGTGYGQQRIFTTANRPNNDAKPCTETPVMSDFDGNVYPTVQIGSQCWMKQNLRTKHYADGSAIAKDTTNSRVQSPDNSNLQNYLCYFYDEPDNDTSGVLGYTYSWWAAVRGTSGSGSETVGVQGVCPTGWHVPSNAEWDILIDYVSSISEYTCGDYVDGIGKALASQYGWPTSNSLIDNLDLNIYGCSPANNPISNNVTGFSGMYRGCKYWSSSIRNSDTNVTRYALYYDSGDFDSEYGHLRRINNHSWLGQIYYYYVVTDRFFIRCLRDESPEWETVVTPPKVTTTILSDVTETTATSGGIINSDGGAPVTAKGVCWSEVENATIADSHTVDGVGADTFTSYLTDLNNYLPTCYYVRAYATNSQGTAYGQPEHFMTLTGNIPPHDALPCFVAPNVTDVDGNIYNSVRIGNQCWMKENLRTTHFPNGASISLGDTASSTIPYRYIPNNDVNVVPEYGYLYNYPAILNGTSVNSVDQSDVQGVCPTGWHIPSDAEWDELGDYLYHSPYTHGYNDAACALSAQNGWYSSDSPYSPGFYPNSNNASGFSALPAGDTWGRFEELASFWSLTGSWNIWTYEDDFRDLWIISPDEFHSVRCVLDESVMLPVVSTSPVSDVTAITASCGGNVISCGEEELSARGICWSTSPNPTVSDNHTTDGIGVGSYSSLLTGLAAGLTYHIRAYATNSFGTTYGDDVVFTTGGMPIPIDDAKPCIGTPSVTDIDGNPYNTVKIGNQCWIKENLRTTHYANGSAVTDFYYPNNDVSTVATYGYLYYWTSVMGNDAPSMENPSGVQGICPSGWHVPSKAEWVQLIEYVSGVSDYVCNDLDYPIGKALASTTGWTNNTQNCAIGNDLSANNATGFSILPAGWYSPRFGFNTFGDVAFFLSSTTKTGSSASSPFGIAFRNAEYHISDDYYSGAYSVRCLRDTGNIGGGGVVSLPSVVTSTVSSISVSSAICGGNVTSDGGAVVMERGVCWSTTPSPTVANDHTSDGVGVGMFSSFIADLSEGVTYYVRAYATNSVGTVYGDEVSFVAENTVPTSGNVNITTCNSWIYDNGGSLGNYLNSSDGYLVVNPVNEEQGIVLEGSYSVESDYDHIYVYSGEGISGTQLGEYTGTGTISLMHDGTLTIRFVSDGSVVNSGFSIHITCSGAMKPAVTTATVTNFTATSAACGGNVIDDNGYTVITRGVCWGTSPNPTIYDNHTNDGNGIGEFSSTITDLVPGTTYYVRAYATNSEGIAYGNEKTFIHCAVPASGNSTITTCDSWIYDNGGSTGDYQNSSDGYLVVNSVTEGQGIVLEGTYTVESNYDHIYIYSGEGISGTLLGNYTGSDSIYLTNNGTVTIRFTSDVSVVKSGFAIHVTCSGASSSNIDGQPCPGTPTVTDYDGNVYNTVQIGQQCWMKENLRTTHYSDGSTILTSGNTVSETAPYYYDNLSGGSINIPLSARGYLYNWPAAMHGASSSTSVPSGVQGVCPTGWHLPSDAEWTMMTDYAKSQSEYQCSDDSDYIAKALASTNYWNSYNGECNPGDQSQHANNTSGFSAVPAGDCGMDFDFWFGNLGLYAYFWTSSQLESNSGFSYCHYLHSIHANVFRTFYEVSNGYSVRCLRDEDDNGSTGGGAGGHPGDDGDDGPIGGDDGL